LQERRIQPTSGEAKLTLLGSKLIQILTAPVTVRQVALRSDGAHQHGLQHRVVAAAPDGLAGVVHGRAPAMACSVQLAPPSCVTSMVPGALGRYV
jgi:hypothetical protein